MTNKHQQTSKESLKKKSIEKRDGHPYKLLRCQPVPDVSVVSGDQYQSWGWDLELWNTVNLKQFEASNANC